MASSRQVPRGSLLKRRKRDADDSKAPGAGEGHVQESAPIGSVGVGREPKSEASFRGIIAPRSEASTVFDGSAAETRERQLKAAENRRDKAEARGIGDVERVKDFAEGSSEVFAYEARHRLRAELDRAAAKSVAEKRRKEKR